MCRIAAEGEPRLADETRRAFLPGKKIIERIEAKPLADQRDLEIRVGFLGTDPEGAVTAQQSLADRSAKTKFQSAAERLERQLAERHPFAQAKRPEAQGSVFPESLARLGGNGAVPRTEVGRDPAEGNPSGPAIRKHDPEIVHLETVPLADQHRVDGAGGKRGGKERLRKEKGKRFG